MSEEKRNGEASDETMNERPGSGAIPRDEGPTLLSLRPPQAPVRGTTVGSDHEPGPPPAVRERSEKDGGVKGRAKPVGRGG